MSKSPDDIIKAPDDSLSNYFDDLLGSSGAFEDQGIAEVRSIPMVANAMVANAGMARVVALPTKKKTDEKPRRTVINPKIKPQPLAKTDFAEPELVQSQEQKLKLEKLLQSARSQLLVEPPPIDVLELQVQTKTVFVNDPFEIQEWDLETTTSEVVGENLQEPVEQEIIAEDLQLGHFQMEGLEWLDNGRPQWAQSRFDVLLFKVSGLTLAVPLISLGQIQPLTDELTPLFGQADWFMGLQPTAAGKIRTVNTAKFVMPERYDPGFLETAKYVMSINGVPWGLAVDSVNQPITLLPEDVKWRGDRSKRPWLAGTVKDHMCALLDIPRIGQMLVEADKNFVPS